MEAINAFVKERNEALFSLDREKIEKYYAKCGQPIPDNDIIFWAAVHKCISNITTAPKDLVDISENWLLEHNMSPKMF